MFELNLTKTFFASGSYFYNNHSIPVQLSGFYEENSSNPVEIKVWSDDENAPRIFHDSMDNPYSVSFEGITEEGKDIFLCKIKPNSITGTRILEAEVSSFIIGDLNRKLIPDQKYTVHINTSPTPLIKPDLIYSLIFDGTITSNKTDDERKGILWENDIGKAKLIDNYEYIEDEKQSKEFTIRIKTNKLFLTFTPTEEISVKDFFIMLPKKLEGDFSLLSFIGRKRTSCYQAEFMGYTKNEPIFSYCKYKAWNGFYNYPHDLSFMRSIIFPKSLQEGVFSQLFSNYKVSNYKEIIDRTLPNLITSYEDGYVESHLLNAYAALESMVDGIGDFSQINNILDKEAFNSLTKKIKKIISNEITDKEIREQIYKKIPELQRKSFTDKLMYLLDLQDVNRSYIWPPEIDETKEFGEIIKRRNELIHRGNVEQGITCYFDLARIQTLVELWILRLLKCPFEAINKYSFFRVVPIDKVIHY